MQPWTVLHIEEQKESRSGRYANGIRSPGYEMLHLSEDRGNCVRVENPGSASTCSASIRDPCPYLYVRCGRSTTDHLGFASDIGPRFSIVRFEF